MESSPGEETPLKPASPQRQRELIYKSQDRWSRPVYSYNNLSVQPGDNKKRKETNKCKTYYYPNGLYNHFGYQQPSHSSFPMWPCFSICLLRSVLRHMGRGITCFVTHIHTCKVRFFINIFSFQRTIT